MTWRLAAGVLIVALVGCQPEGAVEMKGDVHHPNGLTVSVPAGFTAVETANGFEMMEGGDLRAPRSVAVARTTTAASTPAGPQRAVGDWSVTYALVEGGVGSGGTHHTLSALARSGPATLTLWANEQSESAADFGFAWAVLATARAVAPADLPPVVDN